MDKKTQRSSNSGENLFSFPIPNIITPIQEHDFEFNPSTPESPSPDPDFPADHLFLNGRLLPHSFPPAKCGSPNTPSGTTSVTTSRSNSINSTSDGSERRLLKNCGGGGGGGRGKNKVVMSRLYITPVLAAGLAREGSVRRKKRSDYRERRRGRREGRCRRILRSILLVCRECHAMEEPFKG